MAVVIVLAVWTFLIASVGIYRYATGTIELSVNRFRNQLMVLERTRTTFAITSNGTTVTATKSKEKIKVAQSHRTHQFPMPSSAIHRRRQILVLLVVAFVMTTVVSMVVTTLAFLSIASLSLLAAYVLALFVTAGLREGSTRARPVNPVSIQSHRSGQRNRPQIDATNDTYYGAYGSAKVASF